MRGKNKRKQAEENQLKVLGSEPAKAAAETNFFVSPEHLKQLVEEIKVPSLKVLKEKK